MTRYKHLQIYTRCLGASVALALGLTSCVDDNGIEDPVISNESCIEFILSADDLLTRTVTGDNSTGSKTQEFLGPEKMMNTVDIFFYAKDAGENDAAVYYHHIDNTSHGSTEKIMLDESLKTTLFGSESKCKVYTVVNVTDDAIKTGATLAQLRAIKAKTATFATNFNGFAMFTKASEGDEVTYDDATRKATGILNVRNLASKIDLFVSFGSGDTKTVSGVDPNNPEAGFKNWNVWNPSNTRDDGKVTQKGSAEVYLVNGSTVVPLKGWETSDFDDTQIPEYIGNDGYFDLRNDNGKYSRRLDEVTENTKAPAGSDYYTESAVYSYPNKWTTDIVEQHQTYLMLKVNWLPDDIPDDQENVESDLVETYYKIPINISGDSENRLLHNRYYRVKVNINTLGGQNFGAPMELEASCEVLPWGGTNLNADIFKVRYLEVTQLQTDPYMADPNVSEYQAVMHNTTMAYIPYNSSHKIKLSEVKMQFYNFNTKDYTPVKVNILSRRDNSSDLNENNDPISVSAFLLDKEKFAWYKAHDEEPNGVVIDEANSRIVFYHSVYPLAGYTKQNMSDAPASGIYGKKGDKTYSPFFIRLKIEHVDDPGTFEYINILQYPGVFVTFSPNSGYTYDYKGDWVSIGYRVANGSGNSSSSGDNGRRLGVYINGGATATFNGYNAGDGSNSLQFGGIGGTDRDKNFNMYVIHATQLSDDDVFKDVSFGGEAVTNETKDVRFHIGDPRNKHINNDLAGDGDLHDSYDVTNGWSETSYNGTSETTRNAFRRAPATKFWNGIEGYSQRWYAPFDNNASLTYYYPTAEGQLDEQAFMIAPVFRLAGGNTDVFIGGTTSAPSEVFGTNRTTEDLKRENARRRCAALQNSGYPAGRWRLPTIGEVLFFKFLEKKKVLPKIFAKTDKAIWSAQYLFKFDKDNVIVRTYSANDNVHRWVRCVYDDWYWVDENGNPEVITKENTFVWGKNPDSKKADYMGPFQTDGSIWEMFVWGDKPKNNPQDQPQDQTPNP